MALKRRETNAEKSNNTRLTLEDYLKLLATVLIMIIAVGGTFLFLRGATTKHMTEKHILENHDAISNLVASTARDQLGITIDPSRKPFILKEAVPHRYTQPGTKTIIGRLEYPLVPPTGAYLTADYIMTYRVIDRKLYDLIYQGNYRLEDAFLDRASIRLMIPGSTLRTETVTRRDPVRIARAETRETQ